jgi:hypothetical protein
VRTAASSLKKELALFEQKRADWLHLHRGKFVVIVETRVLGFFPDFDFAVRKGLQIAGLGKDFLVKEVLAEDPVYAIF